MRQLADVALRALSPGVNDPTTAHDAIVHLAAVLSVAYRREPPVATSRGDHGQIVSQPALTHAEMTTVAFDEIRRAANVRGYLDARRGAGVSKRDVGRATS